jgi:serine/threonine protein kinase
VDARFGPFRVLSRIAKGSMGDTFVAERAGLAGVVHRECLKRIYAEDCERADWVELFQKEARIAASLSHQNIIALRDFGQERGIWWQSLELVEGTDLGTVLAGFRGNGERLSFEAVLHIVGEVGKALAYAHARRAADGGPLGLVHRDVTPSNILVSYRGEVRLGDFGIAKVTESERTRTDRMKGKAPYISPEHAIGDAVDGRADLFALGVVMFELLTGERPYDGANRNQTMMNAVEGRRTREIRKLVAKGTPEAVIEIVEKLIASDREKRYANADALWDAVTTWAIPAREVRMLGTVVRASRPAVVVPDGGLLTEGEAKELAGRMRR